MYFYFQWKDKWKKNTVKDDEENTIIGSDKEEKIPVSNTEVPDDGLQA